MVDIIAKCQSLTLLSPDKFKILRDIVESVPEGNFAEVGVYKGGAALFMASACRLNLVLFDTFKGISNADSRIDGHQNGDFADTSLSSVRETLSEYSNVIIIPGLFPKSASVIEFDMQYSFVHLDGDTYQTTIDGLNYFWDKMVYRGHILLDDYEWCHCKGVKKAIDEFLSYHPGLIYYSIGNQFVMVKT